MTRMVRRIGGAETTLLGFVVVVLLLLSLTPLAFEREIRPHRTYIEEAVQPARESVRIIESRLTEEVALSRGYLLTGDESLLEEYRRVQEAQRASLERLRVQTARLEEPEVREEIGTLATLVGSRHEPVTQLRRGQISRDEYVARLSARQELLATTTSTVHSAVTKLIRLERARRERIRKLHRRQNATVVVLGVLSLLAVVATAWVAVRLRQRAREEAALRRIASVMNAALGVDQIARWIAGNALSMLAADAVIVERVDPQREEIELAATAGQGPATLRSQLRYPGALLPQQIQQGGSRRFGRVADEKTPTGTLLAEEYAGWSGAVFPLMSDRGALGSLVVLRAPGRPLLATSEIQRGDVLADLAALAMSKVLLLERSQTGWERTEHLLEARSRLIRGFSHDLRNPLGAILGYAELLETGVQGDLSDEQRQYVRRIRKAGESMDSMIQHLVEVGRSNTAEVPFSPQRVSVRQIVQEVVEEHRAGAEQSGLELIVNLSDEPLSVESDPVHIRTILGNLLSNAVKYTSDGGIEVRAGIRAGQGGSGAGRWIVVEVQDTGPGIEPEDQEIVFDEFSRLHSNRAPGEGIGLASSRRVARRLGGELQLESSPGHGSIFVFTLPAPAEERSPVPEGPGAAPGGSAE